MTVHLILAVLLTGVVLLQRSEGGGLGMGGGTGGVMSGRQAANALTRLTWIFGIALFVTSIALTIIAASQVSNSSIMDQLGVPESRQNQGTTTPQLPAYTPPPSTGGDPLTPPAPDAAAPAASTTTEAPAAAAPVTPPSANEAAPATEAPAEVVPEATAPAAPAADNAAEPPAPAN
nr:preprotein translocase subunit SecG [Paracoccus amoyensis]